jgi:hypothetical protein
MTTRPQRIADGSTLVELVHATITHLRAWVAASWLANTSTTVRNGLETATRASLLAEAVRTNVYWIRHSVCYRWLTKDPDPDVIVIDLRETYTVGPLIALFDRLAPTIERTWRGSRAYRLTDALQTSSKLEWIADSRTVQLLAAAVEPPELSEEAAEGSSEGDER